MKNLRLFSKEQEYQSALQTWGGGQYVTYTEDTNKVFYNPQQEVPFAYKQIKGIENRSNAYIDTGYRESETTTHSIRFDYLQSLNGGLYEGGISSIKMQNKEININYTLKIEIRNPQGDVPEYILYQDGTINPIIIPNNIKQDVSNLTINCINSYDLNIENDVPISFINYSLPIIYPCIGPEYLPFSYDECKVPVNTNSNTTILKVKDSYLKTKLYEVTIKESDKVKVHLLPVKRISDGKIGMYDTINNKFLTSPNGTEFIGIE